MIRKIALQVGAAALLAFIAWNAYLAVNHLKQMQGTAARTLESSMIQASISNVLQDLADMETSQRGYLLTGTLRTCSPTTSEE
jgi:CHASE3 domain sensor protein